MIHLMYSGLEAHVKFRWIDPQNYAVWQSSVSLLSIGEML